MKGVYNIHCSGNDKNYIGSTINLLKRKSSHFAALRRGNHDNPIMQHSFNKYGEDTFTFSIIEIVEDNMSRSDLFEVEQKYMDASNIVELGFNISIMAKVCVKKEYSEEEKSRMRNRMLGKLNHFYGKRHSEETKNLIKEKARERYLIKENNPFYGKTHTEETKEKIRATKLAKTQEPGYINHMVGVKRSEDYKLNMSRNMTTNKLVVIDDIEYHSQSEAGRKLKLDISTIVRRVKSKNFPNYIRKSND